MRNQRKYKIKQENDPRLQLQYLLQRNKAKLQMNQ